MTNNKILIVDDIPEIREVLNFLLSSEGYDVIEAKDGQEAIDMVSDDIDLYILDIMMPIINGYQACVEIRKKSNAPILFLTAKGQESDKTFNTSLISGLSSTIKILLFVIYSPTFVFIIHHNGN